MFICIFLCLSFKSQASQISQLKPQSQILIFVSSSMPESSLKQWFHQAQQIHAPIILRGFVGNSLQETQSWLKSLEQEQITGIEINPMAFEAYGITQVPAIVVTSETLQCNKEKCQASAFDLIYGNTSLAQALKILSEKGVVWNQLAKQTLIQLEKNNE